MYRLIILVASIFITSVAVAQFHVPVLPDLEGEALLEALQDNYRTSTVLPYSVARDTLYANIDARNDTLYCVYTGHGIYIPPGVDPTEAVFQGGNGLNAEHTYPRSKGTSAMQPEADMHHLFPTRVKVNADRGSLPFDNIANNNVSSWYYLEGEQSNTPPGQEISLYSKLWENVAFEPRDDHKGDVARAMFYVFAIYQNEVMAADPNFFEQQRTTLCLWNEADPVDTREWNRTYAIAQYQDGIANPFIQDCTLATRTFCGGITPECIPTSTTELHKNHELQLNAYPNPSRGQLSLNYVLPFSGEVAIDFIDLNGRILGNHQIGPQISGEHEIDLNLDKYKLHKGLVYCRLVLRKGGREMNQVIPIITN
jgi:hypothetical protein